MEKQSTRKFLKLMIALVALFLLGSSALMLASCKEELHKHTWDEGKVTTEATCVSTGSRTYTCSDCGDIRIETIPATGVHTWGDPVEYAASCESDAYTIETCTVCGQEKTTIKPNTKRDHNYAEHIVAASCTEAGSRTMSCTYCNDTFIDSHYASEHPALGHSFAANEKEDDTLYGVPAKNVSAAGADDVTVEITLNEETYTGTGASEAAALAAAVAEAKEDGWTTKTAPNCTTAGEFVRTCSRCQITETAEAKATGHKVAGQTMNQTLAEALAAKTPKQYVCTVDTNLIDAENKAIYAFECVNENCPVNVKINAAGTTKHYVEAEAHKYGEAVPSENADKQHPAATCEGKGYTQTTCEVCGKIEYTEVDKLGHNWNTMQLNGTTATGKCEKDTILSGTDGLKKMAEFVKKYLDDDEVYLDEYKKVEAAYTKFFTDDGKKDASRFCLRCYAIDEATDHEYVIGTLQDGKYAPTDYIVDENGDPVVAEGVTKDTMTCRNVEVCKNCGKTGNTGTHDFDPADATCRSGAICSVCNQPQTAQKEHEYVNVATIIADKDKTDPIDGLSWETTITWKDAYAAYQKVSASLEWMAPVPGTCTTAGYNVAVCVHCLKDAADGVEFDWKRDELDESAKINALPDGKTYSAYTQAVSASHQYEAAYFYTDVATPVKAEALSMYQLNCQVGYKTAYFCKNCDLLYTNVPEVSKGGENDPAADNKPGTLGYTDKAGFVISKDVYTGEEPATEWTQAKVDEVLAAVEDNIGDHALYIPNDYRDVKYTPATCASYAKIYYRCANCSYGVELEIEDSTGKVTAPEGCAFAVAGDDGKVEDKLTGIKHDNKLNNDDKDKKYDPKNHAGTEFACGDHCMVTSADGKKYICSGFVSQEPGTTLGDKDVEKETAAMHESVTITYLWSMDDSVKYYKSYDIRFATVTDDDIDAGEINWTNVEISEKPETYIKACASTSTTFIPMGEKDAGNTKGVYLVLVKGDDVYPVKDGALKFYTEDTASTATEVKPENKPQQDDQFFVRFTATGTTVTDAPVVAVDTDSFELALNGAAVPGTDKKTTLTITVGANFEVKDTFTWGITEADNYVVDLGGYTLTSNVGKLLTIGDNLTVKNGKFVFNAVDSGLAIDAAGCTVTFDNVDLVFEKGEGLEIAVDENMANVVFNNSSVTVNAGTKGIYTTGTVANTSNAVTLKDTDVTVVPSTGNSNTAAMVIEVPVTVNVTGGTFTGTYQAIVVRAGTVTVDGATLDVKNDKSVADTEPTKENFSGIANDGTYNGTTWNQFAANITLQKYRQHGIWTKDAGLAGLPRAAVVVGSSGDSAVKFSSTVKLTNITYANADYAKVVVGAYFGADAEDITVNVTSVDYILCDNYTDGIVTINGTVQKHPAN